jgi:hypothetical protein
MRVGQGSGRRVAAIYGTVVVRVCVRMTVRVVRTVA